MDMKLRALGHAKPLSIVGRRTKPYGSVASYVIALSQTDTIASDALDPVAGRMEKMAATTNRAACLGLLAAALLVLAATRARGAGELDLGFGTAGRALTVAATVARALVVQPDGRLIAAGSAGGSGNPTVAVTRWTANGELDASFGSGGVVLTSFSGVNDVVRAVALQPDGRVVVAGGSANGFALARFLASGALDGSFGDGGRVMTNVGATAQANALVVQPDGKLVAAGVTDDGTGGRFALVRYMPSGAVDATFGSGGAVTTAPGSDDAAMALVLEPNGRLVAAGVTRRGGDGDFALVRYLPNGTLDTGFGPGGVVTTDLSGDDAAMALVREPDGRLVAAGVTRRGGAGDFALVRYDGDGALDGTFGAEGAMTTDFGGDDVANGLLLTPAGDIVAVGSTSAGTGGSFALTQYTAAGILDDAFGSGGTVTTNFSGHDLANAGAAQANGNIVVAGQSGTELALARYLGTPAPSPRSFTAVEEELDALLTAIAREVPAGAVEAALAGLASSGNGLALLAEQDFGLGRHHRAISRLGRAVRLLTRLDRRLRSPAVRRMTGVAVANALAVQTGHVARDLRILRTLR